MTLLLVIAAALLLDSILGEPKRFHPLVGFGRFAGVVERGIYGKAEWRGALAVSICVAPFVAIAALIHWTPIGWLFDALLLYLALGRDSLKAHAQPVRSALRTNQLVRAREHVARMVSRDTRDMQPTDVSKAAVESVLENGNDAVFGALFWFIVAGAPGAVAYRLVNTLDAMWGYRNDRYRAFGWAAARLDDALNFIPARLTALSYALAGRAHTAIRCWRAQAHRWDSPNAGPVMAAGAGSLGVTLGGAASYDGELSQRPTLGEGRAPDADDIERALRLVDRSLAIWLFILLMGVCLARLL
jgi:adenosylcobinamide-phosphate synthase